MLKCIVNQFQLRVFFPSQAHMQAHRIPPHLYLCCPQEQFQPCLHLLMHIIVFPHPPYLPYPPQYHHLFLLHNPVCPHFLQCYHIHIHPHHTLLLLNPATQSSSVPEMVDLTTPPSGGGKQDEI